MSKSLDLQAPLQRYYNSFESRVGYRLVLGGTRHFGYYPSPSSWPFPIDPALRAMEAKLLSALQLPEGSKVLDGGSGNGHVALYLAENGGLEVTGVDIIPRHVQRAKKEQSTSHAGHRVTFELGDYQHLDRLRDGSLDGAYTMETLTHVPDPQQALNEFARVLRPDGRIVLYEYEHEDAAETSAHWLKVQQTIVKYGSLPGYTKFRYGVLESMLLEAGFVDIVFEDLTKNIEPMLWFFYILAFLPYMLVRLFGLQKYFINTVSGYECYVHRHRVSYVQVSARRSSSSPVTRANDNLRRR